MVRTRVSSVPPCFSSTSDTSAYPTSMLSGSTPMAGSTTSGPAAAGASAPASTGLVRTAYAAMPNTPAMMMNASFGSPGMSDSVRSRPAATASGRGRAIETVLNDADDQAGDDVHEGDEHRGERVALCEADGAVHGAIEVGLAPD